FFAPFVGTRPPLLQGLRRAALFRQSGQVRLCFWAHRCWHWHDSRKVCCAVGIEGGGIYWSGISGRRGFTSRDDGTDRQQGNDPGFYWHDLDSLPSRNERETLGCEERIVNPRLHWLAQALWLVLTIDVISFSCSYTRAA